MREYIAIESAPGRIVRSVTRGRDDLLITFEDGTFAAVKSRQCCDHTGIEDWHFDPVEDGALAVELGIATPEGVAASSLERGLINAGEVEGVVEYLRGHLPNSAR